MHRCSFHHPMSLHFDTYECKLKQSTEVSIKTAHLSYSLGALHEDVQERDLASYGMIEFQVLLHSNSLYSW